MNRVFGWFEVIFDVLYLVTTLTLGLILFYTGLGNPPRMLAGSMALILVFGDAFHLLPRIKVIISGNEKNLRRALGRGKQIASITMTGFYLLMWQMALLIFPMGISKSWSYIIYLLAAIRVILCLLPQNQWQDRYPPVNWGIWRNIPFVLIGTMVSGLFLFYKNIVSGMGFMWIAIIASFVFYIPVVLWAHKNPKIGMLMLPKTLSYVWMVIMFYVSTT